MARIAILWAHWSGYMEACYRALRQQTNEEPFVCHEAAAASAPFDPVGFLPKERLIVYDTSPDKRALIAALEDYAPDLILISSWHIDAYRAVARKFRGRAVRVLGMDNQWQGSVRQLVGLVAFRTVWRGLYDFAFVPGARQVAFARLLGFNAATIRLGLYAADVTKIQELPTTSAHKDFVFIGRDVPEKGLETLLEAYRGYRAIVQNPRTLVLVGRLRRNDLDEGVTPRGFVQPADLPELLITARALIVPSKVEPHGVVVHEAAAAGAVLICSDAVGAADLFLRRGINGMTFPTGSTDALRNVLVDIHDWSEVQLGKANEVGRLLALQFVPEMWAAELIELAKSTPH